MFEALEKVRITCLENNRVGSNRTIQTANSRYHVCSDLELSLYRMMSSNITKDYSHDNNYNGSLSVCFFSTLIISTYQHTILRNCQQQQTNIRCSLAFHKFNIIFWPKTNVLFYFKRRCIYVTVEDYNCLVEMKNKFNDPQYT